MHRLALFFSINKSRIYRATKKYVPQWLADAVNIKFGGIVGRKRQIDRGFGTKCRDVEIMESAILLSGWRAQIVQNLYVY